MTSYELVIRRVGGKFEIIHPFSDTYSAVAGRCEVVDAYQARGFTGQRNGAAHYRLTKFDVGTLRRIRLDIFIRETRTCWN